MKQNPLTHLGQLLTRIGETIDQYGVERRQVTDVPMEQITPQKASRLSRLIRWFLPNGGTLLIVLLLIATQSVWSLPLRAPSATSTSTISYQGRLADAGGEPVTGLYNMEFRIYDVPDGGTPLWEEYWTGGHSVQVSDGLFNVMLGSIDNTLASAIAGHDELYLGITVGTDTEMSPKVQLGSVPFSFQAQEALTVSDGSITTAKIEDGAVSPEKLNVTNKYRFSRSNDQTINYTGPTGQNTSLDIASCSGDSWCCDAANTICYKPDVLSFKLQGAYSLACTLLHAEDDNPGRSAGLIFATDSGNDGLNPFGTWGAILQREGSTGIPLVTNTAYAWICW